MIMTIIMNIDIDISRKKLPSNIEQTIFHGIACFNRNKESAHQWEKYGNCWENVYMVNDVNAQTFLNGVWENGNAVY